MADKICKTDLVSMIHGTTHYEKYKIQLTIEDLFTQIKTALKQGKTIEIRGFGSFVPKFREGRDSARNPKTGGTIKVEPHYVATFKPGQELKKDMRKIPVTD